jgi:FkbM family methyltransferase
MSKESIEQSYLKAIELRKSFKNINHFGISELLKFPKFFNWVECGISSEVNFLMFLASADDGVALRFFWNSLYEGKTIKLWSSYATNSKNITVDIGAHTGVYTLAALSAGCKNVVSFEPYFMNFARLLMNLRANNFGTEGAYMLGVGSASTEEFLSISTGPSYLSTGGQVGARKGSINYPINLVALDHFFNPEMHIIDTLKIDVEGFEPKVLSGAINLISHSKPVIFFECLSDETGLAISSILEPLGYKFWMIDDLEEKVFPISRLTAELDSSGNIIMSRLNRIASCSNIEFEL